MDPVGDFSIAPSICDQPGNHALIALVERILCEAAADWGRHDMERQKLLTAPVRTAIMEVVMRTCLQLEREQASVSTIES